MLLKKGSNKLMKFIPTTSLTNQLSSEMQVEFKDSKSWLESSSPKYMKTLFISSYIPRKCGIATFTRDLTTALNHLNNMFPTQIMVMDNPNTDQTYYPSEAKIITNQQDWADYKKAIKYINQSPDIDLVCIQHEFGIYGGVDGEMIIPFIKRIQKPIVTTFHTILPNPNKKQIKIIQLIAHKSKYVVVMMKTGAKLLQQVYSIPEDKIRIIPHGVPNFPKFGAKLWKTKLKLEDKVVMSSVNLLSPAKGIEYAISSLPEIVKVIPNFIYQVVGQTHPNELKNDHGRDIYREKLLKLADDLKVTDYIRFVNKYVPLEDLVGFISATDYYVTPYIDPQQITSGALAYAIGAGKTCISTPYLYAKELLGSKRGILVPFEGSNEIAKAIINLHKNPELKKTYETKTYQMGKLMTWDKVAMGYQMLFKNAIQSSNPHNQSALNYATMTNSNNY